MSFRRHARRQGRDTGRSQFFRIDSDDVAIDRLSGNKSLVRDRGDRIGSTLILITNVGYVGLVDIDVVVDICDLRAIDDRRVRDIDALYVALTHMV